MSSVRVRFAPSPTGDLHLGSALTAVANAAFARTHAGRMLLRIDDTDRERSTAASTDAILDVLAWLGIEWQEGPASQAAALERHQRAIDGLLDRGRAYRCFCSPARLEQLAAGQRAQGLPPRYDGRCRGIPADAASGRAAAGEPFVVRLRVPDRAFDFTDAVRGNVAAPPGSFGDFVLQRSDGSVGYLFASVCDDVHYDITHVLRGEDHLANTPRQLAVFDALDAAPPTFAHLPLLLAASGRKLSKRDPLGSVDDLRREGLLARSVRRYLLELLGQGAVDLEELAAFELARVPASAPRVDPERLASIGREDLAALGAEQLSVLLLQQGIEVPGRALPLLDDLAGGQASLGALAQALDEVLGPPDAQLPAGAGAALAELEDVLDHHDLDDPVACQQAVRQLRERARERRIGIRDMLQPARIALTGAAHGPRLELVLYALGPAQARARVGAARLAAGTAGDDAQ